MCSKKKIKRFSKKATIIVFVLSCIAFATNGIISAFPTNNFYILGYRLTDYVEVIIWISGGILTYLSAATISSAKTYKTSKILPIISFVLNVAVIIDIYNAWWIIILLLLGGIYLFIYYPRILFFIRFK